jgi:hypothetical protein
LALTNFSIVWNPARRTEEVCCAWKRHIKATRTSTTLINIIENMLVNPHATEATLKFAPMHLDWYNVACFARFLVHSRRNRSNTFVHFPCKCDKLAGACVRRSKLSRNLVYLIPASQMETSTTRIVHNWRDCRNNSLHTDNLNRVIITSLNYYKQTFRSAHYR